MRGQQHCAALLIELGNKLPQGLAQFYVHARCGLVQNDDRGFVHQGLRYQHAALHAARELAHVRVGLVGQAQAVQQFVNPGIVVLYAKVTGLDPQHIAHVEEGVKHQLLRHHAQLTAGMGVVRPHIVAVHQNMPGGSACEARQNADEGGFAGPIGPQQTKKFALFDV